MGNVNTSACLISWTRSASKLLCSVDSQLLFQTVLFLQTLFFRWKMLSFSCPCVGCMYIKTSGKELSTTGTKTWRKLLSKQSSILFQFRAEEYLGTRKKTLLLWKVQLSKSKPWSLCCFKLTKSEVRSKSCFFHNPEPKVCNGFPPYTNNVHIIH